MSNPSHNNCPSDISYLSTTDYRPSKTLYQNVKNANKFRLHLQRNGLALKAEQLARYENNMKCCLCEGQPKQMKQFNAQPTCGRQPQRILPGFDQNPVGHSI